ncbi:MAG: JAB domain-containing protein, partial [Pseudolysinimonas sp.]
MDAAHRIIAMREMFHGTLTQASVYPREIVRHAMLLNAAAIMLAHCHPSSGDPTPSRADEHLTKAIVDAMRLVDVKVLDHFVVGAGSAISFAESGLL